MTDQRDPHFVARNSRRSPIDDPPICERTGCGHLWGLHRYTPKADTHAHCGVCDCPKPI